MLFPAPYESVFAVVLYMFLLFIVAVGSWQFVKSRYQLKEGESMRMRSLIPLGGAAAAFGIVGLLKHWADAFEAIELAQDISPAIVAEAMKSAVSYPFLGFFILAVSCVFRYVNTSGH
jgi:hypothetical protein